MIKTEDDGSLCQNMFLNLKSVLLFPKILICLLLSRPFGNINSGYHHGNNIVTQLCNELHIKVL